MPILKLETVGFKYSEAWALRNVSFEVREGEFVGVIGPNGSGKTTLLKVINGMLRPQEGRVRINGSAPHEMKRDALARLVAVVPQNSQMVFPFSVQEIVLMGRSPHLGRLRFEGEADFLIARRAMESTETLSLKTRSMNELSGGERQRVLIARALAQQPRIMLLDEPMAFLDIRHQLALLDLIKALTREQPLTVIAVTHDINMASLYCDRIVLLNAGLIHAAGSPVEVVTEACIEEVYRTRVSVVINPVTGVPQVNLLGPAAACFRKEQGGVN
jgi:iron complex transport system ATP-binding protein